MAVYPFAENQKVTGETVKPSRKKFKSTKSGIRPLLQESIIDLISRTGTGCKVSIVLCLILGNVVKTPDYFDELIICPVPCVFLLPAGPRIVLECYYSTLPLWAGVALPNPMGRRSGY